MSPSKVRLKTVTAKAELIREMLAAIQRWLSAHPAACDDEL
jgi:hypothetical protein